MDDFDGGGMRSPLMMMSMIAPIMISMAMVTMLAPLVLYVVARWRQNREPVQDPQLGVKFALCFFRQLGYQTILLGAFVILWSMTSTMLRGGRDYVMRPGFGVLVAGLLVWGAHNLALQRTNRIEFPAVERLFAGYNLLTVGMLGFVALVLVIVSLFSKGSAGETGRVYWSMALVYTSAWATQGVMFLNRVLDAPPAPTSMAPPSSSIAPPAATGTADAPWTKPLA
jgi:hypothetical protein